MENAIRQLLLVAGLALLILGVLQFFQWLIGVTIYQFIWASPNVSRTLQSMLVSLLATFQPIGLGALCLFAAHKLSPLQKPFRRK